MEGFLAIFDLNSSYSFDYAKWLRHTYNKLKEDNHLVEFSTGQGYGIVIVSRINNSDGTFFEWSDRAVYIQGWVSPTIKYNPGDLISLTDDKFWSTSIFQDPSEIINFSGGFQAVNVNKETRTLTFFSDRTASRPIYYSMVDDSVIVSSDLRWILTMPNVDKQLDFEALTQFIRIQTILENRTLYKNIKRIPQGSFLTLQQGLGSSGLSIKSYWNMLPLKPYASDEEAIQLTAHEFINAGASITRGNLIQKSGILLSGGMDSRATLSLVKPYLDNLVAFTFGMGINHEILIASKIARTVGIPWNFFNQTAIDYLDQIEDITEVLQAHYSLAHINTFKSAKNMSFLGIQTIYHGGLMDPFFAGSYLPKEYFRIRGRNLYTYRLAPLAADKTAVAQLLLASRDIQKGDFTASLLDEKYRELWESSSYLACMSAVDHVAESWESPYDWFEKALVYSGFSEFYTYPVTASIRLFAKERSVLYESNILDLYLRLNVRQRFLGHIYRRAMLSVNKEITKIVYPNVGVNPLTHPFIQALSLQSMGFVRYRKDKLKRFLSNVRNTTYHPIPQGCYPSMKDVVYELATSRAKNIKVYREMLCNGSLIQANIVSGAKIKTQLEKIDSLEENDALTIVALLSLSSWLEKYPAKI